MAFEIDIHWNTHTHRHTLTPSQWTIPDLPLSSGQSSQVHPRMFAIFGNLAPMLSNNFFAVWLASSTTTTATTHPPLSHCRTSGRVVSSDERVHPQPNRLSVDLFGSSSFPLPSHYDGLVRHGNPTLRLVESSKKHSAPRNEAKWFLFRRIVMTFWPDLVDNGTIIDVLCLRFFQRFRSCVGGARIASNWVTVLLATVDWFVCSVKNLVQTMAKFALLPL